MRGDSSVDTNGVAAAISRELAMAGAAPILVRAELVEKVAQTALGKTPLIMRLG